MNFSDDELDVTIRQPRASLDAQRFTLMPKQAPLASPTALGTSSTTFLLPILLPASAVTQRNTKTRKIVLRELSGRGDSRSSPPATAVLPPDFASADLYIAEDRTFLETSSGITARELKICYERMGVEGLGKSRLRTPYVVTSLDINNERKYRVSLRQDADLQGETIINGMSRPASIIPGIGGLFNSVMTGSTRTSQADSVPRQTLRRPRSISEPRDSNPLINNGSAGSNGSFMEPFGSATRQSLDYQRSTSIDLPRDHNHPYLYPEIKNSPFGPGVAYAEPSLPSSLPTSHELNLPSVREMQSFESGLTAKADEPPLIKQNPAFQFLNKEAVLNASTMATTPYSTLVFDILQTYRGAPLPDRLSESSSEPTIHLRGSSTITAVPRDDPRFVIWGEVYTDKADDPSASQSSHTDLSTTSHSAANTRRRTINSRSGDVAVNLYPTPERLIVAATIERWIAQLTSEREPDWPCFFLTYRIYISRVDLCHLLICRFHWALEKPTSTQDETVRAMVRARTVKMFKYWLVVWFRVDFTTDPELCQVLTQWLNTLRKDPALNNPRLKDALAFVRKLKTLVRECKEAADKLSPVDSNDPISTSMTVVNSISGEKQSDSRIGKPDRTLFDGANPKLPRGMPSALNPQPTQVLVTGGYIPSRTSSHSAPSSPAHPLSSTQTVFQQPLHMAILAPGKPHGPSQYAAVPMHGTLPIQHSTISRVLVNTMGRLGRWSRVLHTRSGPNPSSQLDCSGVSSFDIDQSYYGEQPYIRGVDDYLRSRRAPLQYQDPTHLFEARNEVPVENSFKNASGNLTTLVETAEHDSDAQTPQPSIMIPKPTLVDKHHSYTSEASNQGSVVNLESEQREEAPSDPPEMPQPHETPGELDLDSQESSGVEKQPNLDSEAQSSKTSNSHGSKSPEPSRVESDEESAHWVADGGGQRSARHSLVSGESQRNSFFDSSEEDYGEPISGQAAWFSTRSPRSINLVDMDDMSDGDYSGSDGVAQPRAAKRLPHQRDIKYTSTVASLFTTEDATAAGSSTQRSTDEMDDLSDENAPKLAVTYRNLEFIDSDDDEPRDAEAALRRLEGQIDREKQRRKQNKVDGWIQQALAAQKNRDQGDETDGDELSVKDGMGAEEEPRETLPGETGPSSQPVIEQNSLTLDDSGLHPPKAQRASPEERGTSTPTPDKQLQAQPFPSLHDQSRGPSNDGNDRWSESQTLPHVHKHSQSLTHRPSFIKISGSRVPLSPLIPHHHESFVLVNRSTKIAQHLTMIESDLWRNVKFEDLVIPSNAFDAEMKMDVLYWGDFRDRLPKLKGHANQGSRHPNDLWILRARFELMVMFTATEILMTKDVLRPVIVSKFIRIALKCYTLNNFSCLVAIITGLEIPPVQAVIQKMPKGIGAYETRIYENLKSFASSDGNYRLMRETVDALVAAQQSSQSKDMSKPPVNPTTPGFDTSKGCLPFIGIYLSQLYKHDRLPDYIDPTAPTEPVEEGSNGTLTQPRYPKVFDNLAPLPASMTLEPLINVHKQRLIATVVISFLKSQQLTHNYRFATEPKLHHHCLRLRALDMIALHQLGQVDR